MNRLAQLAANPQGTSREEIFLAVASIYRVQNAYLSDRECDLMREILRRLVQDVEMAIRIALAERLADDITAPHDLILLLADDRIEVARPLLLRSALLSEADVLHLIAEASVQHHEALAQRPNIGEPVTEALAKSDAESVLVALVRNATAHIASFTYESLVEKSRRFTSLQEPLANRSDLPSSLATQMCTFVSEALRAHITRNYALRAERIVHALSQAEAAVQSAPPPPSETPADSTHKLIDKLASAGQLKAGFLLRVLQQGQADLFDVGFARLLGLGLMTTRRILYENQPDSVALACRAVGIDRCVFGTVFTLSRRGRGLPYTLSREQLTAVDHTFNSHSRQEALDRLCGHSAA
jgi:uncharacterized protein (DUF2336 family)